MYTFNKKIKIGKDKKHIAGTGWIPPIPDMRDYTEEHPEIKPMVEKLKIPKGTDTFKFEREKIDLRKYCSPIEDQLSLGSCTANAAMGIVEYYENRKKHRYINGSRLFVYKTTRNLMNVVGDTGAWLRTTMGALVLCGVPPEKYWTYTDNKVATDENARTFDDEPPSFVYAIADNYEAIKYYCHDPLGRDCSGKKVLKSVKKYLSYGIPSMFGFFGFPSFSQTNSKGEIPYPCDNENAIWGHAVVAVGYDETKVIKNTDCNLSTKGALLIRNSWGTNWGEKGYGWLPYDYVYNYLAVDFWSLLKMEWVDIKIFNLESN